MTLTLRYGWGGWVRGVVGEEFGGGMGIVEGGWLGWLGVVGGIC